MHLNKIFRWLDLQAMVKEGYVRRQVHPDSPLAIVNYTEKAVYDKHWNDVTLACRGLIYNTDTHEVVARPFPKFFNYEELPPGSIDLSAHVEVTDKMDGSLGIMYHDGHDWAIATRGSFASDQAIHATSLLREKYPDFRPIEGFTYLFEVIYRSNRIVLDYGDQDDLVLIGAVNINTGKAIGPWAETLGWPGPATEILGEMTFAQALMIPPRKNAEGIVIHVFETGQKVKLKQDDYVIAHKAVTGLNDRVIWEVLQKGDDIATLTMLVPEEFRPYIEKTARDLTSQVDKMKQMWDNSFNKITNELGDDFSRKDFADMAKSTDNPAAMFTLLDGRDVTPVAWKLVRPEAVRSGIPGQE